MLPDYDCQVLKLTNEFYNTYPNSTYTEIAFHFKKSKRSKSSKSALDYVEGYVDFYVSEIKKMSREEFVRRYKYSTLQYFHDILGINES